jgi:transposase
MGAKWTAYRILVGKPKGKGPLGRPRHRWMDNIREIGWDGVDWINLAEDRGQWTALMNTIMNLRVPKCWEVLEWLHNWWLLKKDSAL